MAKNRVTLHEKLDADSYAHVETKYVRDTPNSYDGNNTVNESYVAEQNKNCMFNTHFP
jgi:hypothetical protein